MDAVNNERFSLWLRAEHQQEQTLKQLITDVARDYSLVTFHPHLTILGGVNHLEYSQLEELTGQVVEELSLAQWTLTLTTVECGTTFFQSVYLTPEYHQNLITLNQTLQKRLYGQVQRPFMPHISIAYGAQPEEKQRLVKEYVQNAYKLPKSLPIAGLSIVQSGPIEQWKILHTFPF